MPNAAEQNGKLNGANGCAKANQPAMTLPYADFSHAFIRAHHDAYAMAAANRVLADSMRAVLRRQQDLAFELAEAALGVSRGGAGAGGPAAIFDRAAQAVREVGEAMIDAQIEALRMLQNEAEPARPAFAFPAMTKAEVPLKSEHPAPAASSRT